MPYIRKNCKTLTKHLPCLQDQYQTKEKKLHLPKSFMGDPKEKNFRIVHSGFSIIPFHAILNYYYLRLVTILHSTHFYENSIGSALTEDNKYIITKHSEGYSTNF